MRTRTRCKIDSFQQLFDMTAPDFAPLYERVRSLAELPADALPAHGTRG